MKVKLILLAIPLLKASGTDIKISGTEGNRTYKLADPLEATGYTYKVEDLKKNFDEFGPEFFTEMPGTTVRALLSDRPGEERISLDKIWKAVIDPSCSTLIKSMANDIFTPERVSELISGDARLFDKLTPAERVEKLRKLGILQHVTQYQLLEGPAEAFKKVKLVDIDWQSGSEAFLNSLVEQFGYQRVMPANNDALIKSLYDTPFMTNPEGPWFVFDNVEPALFIQASFLHDRVVSKIIDRAQADNPVSPGYAFIWALRNDRMFVRAITNSLSQDNKFIAALKLMDSRDKLVKLGVYGSLRGASELAIEFGQIMRTSKSALKDEAIFTSGVFAGDIAFTWDDYVASTEALNEQLEEYTFKEFALLNPTAIFNSGKLDVIMRFYNFASQNNLPKGKLSEEMILWCEGLLKAEHESLASLISTAVDDELEALHRGINTALISLPMFHKEKVSFLKTLVPLAYEKATVIFKRLVSTMEECLLRGTDWVQFNQSVQS